MLAPTMVVPSLAVVAAATLVIAFWAFVGLVSPGMVNVIALPPVNVPAVNEMVKIKGAAADSAAVPAGTPGVGAVNTRVPAPVSAKPAPLSVILILPSAATSVTGVSVTLMVTAVEPLATLLRVMAGKVAPPRRSTMAG